MSLLKQSPLPFTLHPALGIEPGDPSTFTVTLEDNDIPVISFKQLLGSGEEGSGPHTIKLNLSTPVASEQQVKLKLYTFHTVDYGSDYTTEPAAVNQAITVTIPAGSTEGQFTIAPLTDRRREMPLEFVSFYLDETSDGLIAATPRWFVFSIIDAIRVPHFTVFPNPTSGIIKLTAEELEEGEIILADLRNSHGESVFKGRGTIPELNDRLSQKLQSSKKGVYTLNVIVAGESYLIRIVRL